VASVAHIIRRRRARKANRRVQQTRNRAWTIGILVIVLLAVGIPAGITLGGATFTYVDAVRDLPAPEESLSLSPAFGTTELYDRTGTTLLAAQDAADQQWIALDDLPGYVLQATLLSEDPDFLTVTSFNLVGTFSRLWENALFGPLPLDTTLTGRLVRNVIAPAPDAISGEYIGQEIALVAEIQRRYSPEQILEWHLNTNYYGNQLYGIQSAAQAYLGKDAVDLTVDEAAMLGAIPLAPQYNPFDNEVAARGRQLDLLRLMRANGAITPDQFDLAAATVTPILVAADQTEQIAPEFTAYARRQAQDLLDAQGRDGAGLVARGGLRIITTLDLDLYFQSECAIRSHLDRLNGREPSPDALNGQPCLAAQYMPPTIAPLATNAPDTGSLVLIDAATGEIRSMVGAATVVDEQPGPTLLPFVYFTGLLDARAGFNPAKMVLDIPGRFPGAVEGLIYAPANADGKFRGPINLRDAMSAWLLPPAVQVANSQGLDNVLRYAHRIGLNSLGEDGRYDLSLLERGGAVSTLDIAYAYSVFAAMGDMRGVPAEAVGRGYRQRNPVAVLRIEDTEGNIVWQYDTPQVTQNQVNVFPVEIGYLVNNILSDTARRRAMIGDTPILDLPRQTAIVNGLTSDRVDNWTAGYTPQIVTAVHLKRADETAMPLGSLGLDGAAVIWRAVMQYAHDRDGLLPAEWSRPESVIELPVCERSGLLPNGVCPTRNEIFIAVSGYQPTQQDIYWQAVEINSSTGQRAAANTPTELRVSSLYFIPPPEAEDWWRANNQPLPPEQYDTVSLPELFSSVQILQPQPFAYVGGVVDIRGTLDATNMAYYQLSYGLGQNPTEWIQIGQQQTAFNRGATLGTWDTTGLTGGLYNILLRVVRSDNTSESAAVQVTIDNNPPLVTLSAGEAERIYRWPADQSVELNADVDDDYAIDRVEFYHNGQLLGIDQEWPYGFTWDITRTGTEIFTAVAFDAVGNVAQSEVSVTIERG